MEMGTVGGNLGGGLGSDLLEMSGSVCLVWLLGWTSFGMGSEERFAVAIMDRYSVTMLLFGSTVEKVYLLRLNKRK